MTPSMTAIEVKITVAAMYKISFPKISRLVIITPKDRSKV